MIKYFQIHKLFNDFQLNSIPIKQNIKDRKIMILDRNDPSGLGLFSKCARDRAFKTLGKKQSQGTEIKPRRSHFLTYCEKKNKKKNLCPFDMAESRQQRTKKYKEEITPAVGQYNPKTAQKIKLTWDILKAHHNRTVRRNCPQPQPQAVVNEVNQSNKIIETNTVPREEEVGINKSSITEKYETYDQAKQLRASKEKRSINENRRYQTLKSSGKSQVDMSRMTGRDRNLTKADEDRPQLGRDVDLNNSVKYIKKKSSNNIFFNKQLSRQKVNSLKKVIAVPSDYNCDMSKVKKKSPGMVDYGRMVGRPQKKKLSTQYSYSHYDYDEYVWNGNSNVYPNTKTSVTNFDKQLQRHYSADVK